ncbi:PLK1 [Lepeophtheirus salmonis]|uniref:Serine/threonine-protein kinase PLK n=1 Tax=Lepeophtheirus salmonis TaxID=72036 RepID=A0A7R8H809_LEPSM|nr:PLK1 [Lepeophtheirus salmonis]CAF2930869.1 PLK1 [Lepeophtheirus salmonis]
MTSTRGGRMEATTTSKEIPMIIVDSSSKKQYQKGRFLGKGGFAKCYELTDMASGEVVAGKIVPKSLLTKTASTGEDLYSYFEDSNFVYIILELCRRRSLMELHKRRKAITEPETRYFMNQILQGCLYLHENKVIHRDLKLGNIFLNDDMEVKIGDFGLATKVDYFGERKRTLCGTPNYIAPEVLAKKGHSYEVDVWSLGCIMYTLLVGKPPFETQTLKDTYARIKKNEYHVPSRVGPLAKNLITKLLQSDPSKRPAVAEILKDEFMTMAYMPHRLPPSCLTMAPRFDANPNLSIVARRGPLTELNTEPSALIPTAGKKDVNGRGNASDCYLGELHKQLASVIASQPASKTPCLEDEAEDPKVSPMVLVSKWVDYSDKYGFGYSLSDDSIGVVFNDLTKLLLLSNGSNIHYIDYGGVEHYYTIQEFPSAVEKKVKLLNYFRAYMKEHLLKAGADIEVREGDELFSNSFYEDLINFFKDHTKIILCPMVAAVTYIDEQRRTRTFRFDLIERYGCSQELASRLTYAYDKIEALINNPKGSGSSNNKGKLPLVVK